MLLCTWKDTFIKFSPFRDDILLCRGIVELPAFVTTGITNKHALFHVGLKRAVLVFLNEDICQVSPNATMGDIWFALEPSLIGALRASPQSEGGNFASKSMAEIS